MPAEEKEYVRVYVEPTPISAEQQRIMDANEEEENKKKEHEARM
jgi:hypothetical protein